MSKCFTIVFYRLKGPKFPLDLKLPRHWTGILWESIKKNFRTKLIVDVQELEEEDVT